MNALIEKNRADLRSLTHSTNRDCGQLSLFSPATPAAETVVVSKRPARNVRSLRHIPEGQFVLFDIGVEWTNIFELPAIHEAKPMKPAAPAAEIDMATLIEKHKGLVWGCMKKTAGVNSFNRDDVEQAGYIALWSAAKNFDPSRGVQFSTYATTAIRREMFHTVAESQGKTPAESWDSLLEDCPMVESELPELVENGDEVFDSAVCAPVLRELYEAANTLRLAKERKGVMAYALSLQGYSRAQISKAVGFTENSATSMISAGKKVVRANPLFQRIVSALSDEAIEKSVTVDLLGSPFTLCYAASLHYTIPAAVEDALIDRFARLVSKDDVADYILNEVRVGDELLLFCEDTGCSAVMTVGENTLKISFAAYANQNCKVKYVEPPEGLVFKEA